jgi:hypothetical protein
MFGSAFAKIKTFVRQNRTAVRSGGIFAACMLAFLLAYDRIASSVVLDGVRVFTAKAIYDTNMSYGTIDLTNVPPGNYTIIEIAAPTGYIVDPTPQTITVNPSTIPVTVISLNSWLPYIPSVPGLSLWGSITLALLSCSAMV